MAKHNHAPDKSFLKPKDTQNAMNPQDSVVASTERKAVYEYLTMHDATAGEVSVELNIWRPNVCRHKRELEKEGHLQEIRMGICSITGFPAAVLSCNPKKFRKKQPDLFSNNNQED